MNIKKIIQSSESWKDLNKTLESFTKSNKSKLAGDIFEYLTKLYLETAPQYRSKLKKVYLLHEVPRDVKTKLNLPNTDEGIDLITETFNNEYWAIQCKYRSNFNETLTVKGDLSTFNNLAFTHCKNISHAIVCTTIKKPPKKIKLLKSIGFETLETWLALDDGDLFAQIKARAIGKVYKPTPLEERPYQKSAIKKTIEYFKSNERGKIIMPCGTGKSLTAFWIAKEMGVRSILVAVPSLSLLKQTLKVWTREFLLNNIEPDWLCVCSDGTVIEGQDDFITDSTDLGIKVDTDPRVIMNFLNKDNHKLKIVFTTYQSGRATAIGSKGFTYDLGIMDEAHKTVGSKTKEMAHLLHQKNVIIKKRIFMTATERLFRGNEDEYISMDNPKIYGNLIYELSFKEAIDANPPIITDYKIITFGITSPEIEEITQSNKYLEVKKEIKDITARELATAIALRKAIKKLEIKNAISFHRSIKRAENFKKQQDLISKVYPEYEKIKTFHVNGTMSSSDRAIELLNFKKEKGLITNARCLTEGIDLPSVDCICFADPKRSKVDIVQAVGRALRLSEGKKFGYILIPIFVPNDVDLTETADKQGFDEIVFTVRSLAASDARIFDYLKLISEGKKPVSGSPIDGMISINKLYQVDAEKFENSIQLRLWDKVAKLNYQSYYDCKNYAQSNKIKSAKEWVDHTKSKKFPKDFPSHPSQYYKEEWENWGEFLGTGYIALKHRKFVSYEEASNFAKKKIKSGEEWRKFSLTKDFPQDLPSHPSQYYKEEWKNWATFLGTKNFRGKENFRTYEEASKFIQSKNLKRMNHYFEFCKRADFPNDIPNAPSVFYKDQWEGWGKFLGTGNVAAKDKEFKSYKDASIYAQSQNLVTPIQWLKHVRSKESPKDLPTIPNKTYEKEWINWDVFFNTKRFFTFDEAKRIVSQFGFQKMNEFKKNFNYTLYPRMPRAPEYVYSETKQWKGWVHFLEYKKFLTFDEAKKIVKKLELNGPYQWNVYCKKNERPKNIPTHPEATYKKEWKGWYDFLGKLKIDFVEYEVAKIFASKLGLAGQQEWFRYIKINKIPENIPRTPRSKYKNQWKGWPDFLGNKTNVKFTNKKN